MTLADLLSQATPGPWEISEVQLVRFAELDAKAGGQT